MTSTEVNNGLVLPYAALAIAGKGGAAAVLLITFMAVTSTLSAQVIAVSSIISFDIYRTYFNKDAADADVIRWSHYGVVIFGVVAAAFSTLLHYVGINLGWTLYMLGLSSFRHRSTAGCLLRTTGVLTCPGIFPTVFAILWRRQSKAAAIISPLLGMATGLAVWLGSAHALYGEVTVTTTGNIIPCVYGTVASAFSPLPYSLIITIIKPQNFDWADFGKTQLSFDADNSIADEKDNTFEGEVQSPLDPRYTPFMKRWAKIATFWSLATFLGHWVLWPLPIYASHYVFSKQVSCRILHRFEHSGCETKCTIQFFSAWVVVAIIWLFSTFLVAALFPIIDGHRQLYAIFNSLRYGRHRNASEVDETARNSFETSKN